MLDFSYKVHDLYTYFNSKFTLFLGKEYGKADSRYIM